jgi:hypothetical protein
MRFRTRAFLLCFVPFALLLAGSFWAIQTTVQSTVRSGLRSSLRENQLSMARVQSHSDLQNNRFLKIAGENATLKAGLQLLIEEPGSNAAKQTVEDQLRELCEQMGFDFLMVSSVGAAPLAGVIRQGGQWSPFLIPPDSPHRGLLMQGDRVYQIASVPINQGEENMGELSVGERFDFSAFNTPAVLIRDGKVLQSSIRGMPLVKVEAAIGGCDGLDECDVRIGGESYISLSLESVSLGDGYTLRVSRMWIPL